MPKRVDQNHREIVRALRQVPGVTVWSLADLGKGCPDLLVGYRGLTVLVEVKGAKGKLNAMQEDWHRRWTGSPVIIIRSVDDVETLITAMNAEVHAMAQATAASVESRTWQSGMHQDYLNDLPKEDHD
jgi:Holliday junction resolvase